MIRITNLKLPFDQHDDDLIQQLLELLKIGDREIISWRVLKRSLDARKGKPLSRVYSVLVNIEAEEKVLRKLGKNPRISKAPDYDYQIPVSIKTKESKRPVVVGTGPAGIFAGLILAEAGLEPVIVERGKPVCERARDTFKFWEKGSLDPESNVQFGEGGAGTFSDGKLQTRVKDKQNRDRKILEELVSAGAPDEILFESKPHIGTANLMGIVKNLREKIEDLGGAYNFCTRLDDLIIKEDRLHGIRLSNGGEIFTENLVLAVGHSARDTYEMLEKRGVKLAPKPFSVGFRIEHPQKLINESQFGVYSERPELGAADYQLAYHCESGRTVYSFCMCPGGTVIAAASEVGHLVTNGMSQYKRDGNNANSAIVAEVYPKDFGDQPLAGINFQKVWEKKAFIAGGSNYYAPVQLVGDFLEGKESENLGSVEPTYQPGIVLSDLRELLPDFVIEAILEALPNFDKRIDSFSSFDAVLTAVETRTSAPLRIIRGKDHQSISVKGLYPAGEGSGYAGGIMSSAIDGIKSAEKIIKILNN